MRNELELMDLIERYLDGDLDPNEATVMSQRMAADDGLRVQVEEQRALRAGMDRVGSRIAVVKAYRSYRFWKWAPWIGGLVIMAGIAGAALWATSQHEHVEHERPEQELPVYEQEHLIGVPSDDTVLTGAHHGEIDVRSLGVSTKPISEVEVRDTIRTEQRMIVKRTMIPVEDIAPANDQETRGSRQSVTMISASGIEAVPNSAVLEPQPQFPGGDEAMGNYLMKNLKYPAESERKAQQGRVVISCIVMKDGTIRDARVEQGFDKACDDEALRVVSNMPAWTPGKLNEELVNVRIVVPIVFTLRMERLQ